MINNSKTILGLLAVSVVTLSAGTIGCSTEPKRVEADYGNSISQTVQAQTYNPEAAASTESIPVLGMDGKRSMRTLDAMQTDTERPDDFDDVIDIELGGSR
jgi:hypothetical protein